MLLIGVTGSMWLGREYKYSFRRFKMHRCISCLTAAFQRKSYHIYPLWEEKEKKRKKKKGKANQKILAILSLSPLLVISRTVTCVCQSLLFPFILSWETLAWIGWTYMSAARGIPCLSHRQAMKILPVIQMNCKDHNYRQKFLLWAFRNHEEGKGDWLTTVTLLIDREPKTRSVT